MRPVRLSLNGFAAFREPAEVDFTDADYFALVGPTGSGKSTILDALTFALYGTAARWGRTTAISYALAPTSNRCTVSLIFDIGPQRYQVAREVRRVGKNIQQKAVSLVRFTDPTLLDPDDSQTEVLAGEIKELNTAVEQLLGLSFDDFCQAVVLPQGEFAKFLTAGAADRQKLLLKLLGAEQYDGIGKRAGLLATQAGEEVRILSEQLGRQIDITPERLRHAEQRVTELLAVATEVEALVPQIAAARDRSTQRAREADQARVDASLLMAIVQPDGVGDLQSGVDKALETARTSRQLADNAAHVLAQASAAAQAGPQRATLEVVQGRYDEHAQLTGRRSSVDAAAEQGLAAVATAAAGVAAAEQAAAQARSAFDQAREQTATARTTAERLSLQRDQLAAVSPPDGVADLAQRAAAAQAHLHQARQAHEAATTLVEIERDKLSRCVDRSVLDEASAILTNFITLVESLASAETAHLQAADLVATSAMQSDQARDRLAQAQVGLDEARIVAGAARLRPTLELGHHCPVCDQEVTALPAPLSAPALAAAEESHRSAMTEHERCVAEQIKAVAVVGERLRDLERRTDQLAAADQRLAALLPDRPSGADRDSGADGWLVRELLRTRSDFQAAVAAAELSLTAAEENSRSATAEISVTESSLAAARTELATTRGSLAEFSPPIPTTADIRVGWAELAQWAGTLEQQYADRAELAGAAVAAADQQERTARATLDETDRHHRDALAAHTAATTTAARTEAERDTVHHRLGELEQHLAQAPAAAELAGLFDEAARRQQAAQDATTHAADTRTTATADDLALREWQLRRSQATAALTAARDQVAALGAPTVDADDLVVGWSTLALWARQSAKAAAERAATAGGEAQSAEEQARGLVEQIAVLLGEVTTDHAGPYAERAVQIVAVAVERANGEVSQLKTRLAETADLQSRIAQADEKQKVAKQLATMMRSTAFPQWLAESALDTLVAGASDSLRRLSNDQFDLTHRKGDFFVIDHSDADSERSVRTLSGGETFQASLALALSLSDHLAGMGGTTKLESIFLDEGFGTLDPDSLETVAATLENLAQGDRMVGVITHVGGLAERAPVRFRVQRDTRSSTITRETT